MLKKIFLGLVALFLIFVGSLILLMGYILNRPESVFDAFSRVTDKFMQAEAYEESEEYWLEGIQVVQIRSKSLQLELKPHKGQTLKAQLTGEVPRFERGPFLFQEVLNDTLTLDIHEPLASQWISISMNGQETTTESNAQLKAVIYYPEQLKGALHISTKDGSVHLYVPRTIPFETELSSESGPITNKVDASLYAPTTTDSIGKILINTATGRIEVEQVDDGTIDN